MTLDVMIVSKAIYINNRGLILSIRAQQEKSAVFHLVGNCAMADALHTHSLHYRSGGTGR